MLSRDLAGRGHYPAIDVLQSVSRCMPEVVAREHGLAAQRCRALLAAHRDVEPLLALGAYRGGAIAEADHAIALWPRIEGYLRQRVDEATTFEDTVAGVTAIAGASS